MPRVLSELAVLLIFGCIACSDDEPPASEDEHGGTGKEESGNVGPKGPRCDENWYELDGPPDGADAVLPELSPPSATMSTAHRIEFSGPTPTVAAEVDRPVPSAESPSPPVPLQWEEFIATFARPTESGWLIQEDLFLTSEQLYRAYVAYNGRATRPTRPSSSLLGWNTDGVDQVWSGPQKIALTWCAGWVRPAPNTPAHAELHAERYDRIVRAVEESARAWERVTNANFVHLREFDDPTPSYFSGGECQPGQEAVFFRVRMSVANGCEGACKGHTNVAPITELDPEWAGPNNPDGLKRELVMSASSLSSESEARETALHELGHVLGFEHEHIREGFGDCSSPDDGGWRELTPADPKSIMAYESCEGVDPNQPRLSAYDRLGAYYVYNWPRRRSLLMGGVSSIDDFAYDGTGRTGIAWYDAKGATVQNWTSVGSADEPIEFGVEQRCLDGGEPPCDADPVWAHRVRPSPVFASGTAGDLDMLLYGSGEGLDDVLLRNTGAMSEPEPVGVDGHKLPIVGSFSSGIDDQVLFHAPGADSDALLDLETGAVVPVEYSDYAYPLPGWYRGVGAVGPTFLVSTGERDHRDMAVAGFWRRV